MDWGMLKRAQVLTGVDDRVSGDVRARVASKPDSPIELARAESIEGDVVIDRAAPVRSEKGGRFILSSGASLTIRSLVEAPAVQLFDPSDADRIRLEHAPFVRPEWFGAVPDGVTDCLHAILAAIAATADGATGIAGSRVVFQRGVYYCSGPLDITRACELVGAGPVGIAASNVQAATVLRFPVNSPGVRILSHQVAGSSRQGAGSILRDLVIEPATQNGAWGATGPNSTGDGVLSLSRCELYGLRVNGWGRDGIRIDTRTEEQVEPEELINGAFRGNANDSLVENCRAFNNRGAGFHILGQDSHSISVHKCTAITNGGEGFLEESFLGVNAYTCCHADANGRYGPESGTSEEFLPDYYVPVAASANASAFLGCYVEGDPPRRYPELHGWSTALGGNLANVARGAGTVVSQRRRSRLAPGRVVRGGAYVSEMLLPGEGDAFMRFSQSTEGGTPATVTLRVTAGPAGASIAGREKFSSDPAAVDPFGASDPEAPATVDVYADDAHTLAADEVRDIACTAAIAGAAYGNKIVPGVITATTNAGLVSVTNPAAASGGANGPELVWEWAYDNFNDGFHGSSGGGTDSVGSHVYRRATGAPRVFGWTGLSHSHLAPGQFMLFSPMGHSDQNVIQHAAVSVPAGETAVYAFNGVGKYNRANVFGAYPSRDQWHAEATLTSDDESADLRIAWQRYDAAAKSYRVGVANSGAQTRAGHLSVRFFADAIAKS